MKSIALFLSSLFILIQSSRAESEIQTNIESVTIYHSGALVVRSGSSELSPGLNEILIKNVSSKMLLNSLKIGNNEVTILNKTLIRKLTKEEFNQLQDRKEALNNEKSLIDAKFSEAGFVANVEDLEKMTIFYSNRIVQIKKELREIETKIEEAKKLDEHELKNENAAILKLVISLDGRLKSKFQLQYVCGGIGWSPAYDVRVNSSADKTIEIKYLAKVMSQTGEDWDNVTVKLSSSFPLESPTELPSPGSPWILNNSGSNWNAKQGKQNSYEMNAEQNQQIEQLKGVEYHELRIPSYLKTRTLSDKYSIKSNSTVFTFPIMNVELPTHYYYFSYPSIDPEVYLVAEVVDWDTLGLIDGVASMTFDGNDVGKSIIKFSESRDTLLLPVGRDNSVFLKRSEMADKKYFKEKTIGKKKLTTLAYEFQLKNNNSFPVDFVLVDQVPISQSKSTEVEIETISGGDLDNESGEVSWVFQLRPGESRDQELIFTIEGDGKYRYSSGMFQQQYRTVNCPTF